MNVAVRRRYHSPSASTLFGFMAPFNSMNKPSVVFPMISNTTNVMIFIATNIKVIGVSFGLKYSSLKTMLAFPVAFCARAYS